MQLLKSDAKSFGFCNLPNKKIEYYSKKMIKNDYLVIFYVDINALV